MLRAYEAFLLHKKAMKPQYVSFYMKWVSDCYGFLNEPLCVRLSQDQRKQFLSRMAKHHEEWQVKQADAALRLYDYFLSFPGLPPDSTRNRWFAVCPRAGGFKLRGKAEEGGFVAEAAGEVDAYGKTLPVPVEGD